MKTNTIDPSSLFADEPICTDTDREAPFCSYYDLQEPSIRKQTDNTTWESMSAYEREEFGNEIKKFYNRTPQCHCDKCHAAMQYLKIKTEYNLRTKKQSPLTPIKINTSDSNEHILFILESFENIEKIKQSYKLRKQNLSDNTKSGLNTEQTNIIKYALKQGRELYLAGKNSAMLTKPLNYFYSLTAFSYAAIVLNNPLRKSKDNISNSHGLSQSRESTCASFGGTIPLGTFTDLYYSFFTNDIFLDLNKPESHVFGFMDDAINFYKKQTTLGIGSLMSLIPELRESYQSITSRKSNTHKLVIKSIKKSNNVYSFEIGDGLSLPSEENIRKIFCDDINYSENGNYYFCLSKEKMMTISPMIYTDMYGEHWYIDTDNAKIKMSEICIHFIMTYILSNIMRYNPETWGNILENSSATNENLLIKYYLSLLDKKIPFMAARHTTSYYPYITR